MIGFIHHNGEMVTMTDTTLRVRMDGQGRLVIPAEARRALGAEAGESLMLTVADGGRLVIESRSAFLARLRKRFADRLPSVDALLAARAADAEREPAPPGAPRSRRRERTHR
jgi:AbrB family looped-hinge helix DNA binding protein